jgi:hypothetical protein
MKNSCPTIFFSFRQIRLPLARTHQLIWKRIPTWKFTPQSRKFRRRNRAFWIHGTTLIRCHIDFDTWVILFDHRQLLTWLLYMTLENKPTSSQFYLYSFYSLFINPDKQRNMKTIFKAISYNEFEQKMMQLVTTTLIHSLHPNVLPFFAWRFKNG